MLSHSRESHNTELPVKEASSCVDSYVQSLPSSGEKGQHKPQIQFIPLNMTTHILSIT